MVLPVRLRGHRRSTVRRRPRTVPRSIWRSKIFTASSRVRVHEDENAMRGAIVDYVKWAFERQSRRIRYARSSSNCSCAARNARPNVTSTGCSRKSSAAPFEVIGREVAAEHRTRRSRVRRVHRPARSRRTHRQRRRRRLQDRQHRRVSAAEYREKVAEIPRFPAAVLLLGADRGGRPRLAAGAASAQRCAARRAAGRPRGTSPATTEDAE